MSRTLYIFASVMAVSLLSFVGVFGISLREDRLRKAFIFLIPLAVGALLGDAFFHLIPEAFQNSTNPALTSFLLVLGVVSFFILEKYLRWHHRSHENPTHTAEGAEKSKHLGSLILVSDGLHNFIDGIIIGASYLVGIEIGIATTLAIIFHEIPQEIGDFGVLLYAGYKRNAALFYNFLSALTAVLGTAFVLIFGAVSEGLAENAIPFAAGVFIYIASSDLVPELHKKSGGAKNLFYEIIGMTLGLLAMYFLLFID